MLYGSTVGESILLLIFCYLLLLVCLIVETHQFNERTDDAGNRANFCKRDRRGERGGGGKEKEKEKGKKERKRKEEKKKRRRKEGGGVHSPTRFHYSICVSNHVHRSLSTPAAAATAFRAELRYSIFFFPHLPFFNFRPPLLPMLPPPPPPAPPSPPLIPPFVFFFPPTSAILCFRFLLVSRFRFLFTGSFPTSDIHVAYQSPVSSLVGLPRRCSSNGSGNDDCHPPPIECISSVICHSGPASGLHAFHVSRM